MAEPKIAQAVAGMNFDSATSSVKEGEYTYALNAAIENFNGESYSIQNEQANELCFSLPSGYKVIGNRHIAQLNKTLLLLTNPLTGDSEVGFGFDDTCKYSTLISDVGNDCKFGFNVKYPVHNIVIKTTNCSTQAYFTDGFNPRRFIDFDDLPWKEVVDPTNSYKKIKVVGKLDCNKLNVQPDFSIPQIEGQEVTTGGNLTTGVYQGTIQYANVLGEGLTSFYGVTNPMGIFEQKESVDFNLPTAKAITFKISNLDTSGLYEYFNLVVIKTINLISTPEVIGTFPISASDYTYTYSGVTKTDKTINIEDIFLKYPYYDTAQDIFEVDNVLGWGILAEGSELNCQPFWNKVKLYWESYKLPYNQFQGYTNGINSEKFKSYLRDEVYALEGTLYLTNGKQLKSCHIPGRILTAFDLEMIPTDNPDNGFSTIDHCNPPEAKPRWKVYNTASIISTTTVDEDCYIGRYQYGEFAGWESTETYPTNALIWGDLIGKPIRHHKFPDVLISPIHDNNINNELSFEHSIYPIGIRIDSDVFLKALQETFTPAQISQIAGFKITRGNRNINKSIIAKGLIHNVGTTVYDNKTYFFPNYPFNDLRPDPYYVTSKLDNHIGFKPENSLNGFGSSSKNHFVFHSPDTHFNQPSISNTGEFLKLETIEYGQSTGHFVKVTDNAEYKFLTPRTINAAAGLALASGIVIGAGTFGWPNYNMASTVPTYTATIELFEKLAPFLNFGYSFNSVGNYANSYYIPNAGNKQRGISYNKYVIDGLNGVEAGAILNNFRRESSVYIATSGSLLFPHEYSSTIPVDNSRYNLASIGDGLAPEANRTTNICSYYGSIKRDVINQWGRMYSYETIDTGFYQDLKNDKDEFIDNYPTVFGGDTFINRFAYKSKLPFFRDNTVGPAFANQTDIAYDEIGNLNYPMFWVSTKASRYDIDVDSQIEAVRRQFLAPSVFNILSNLFTGGSVGAAVAMSLVGKLFSEIYQKIGLKNVNMDRASSEKLFEEGLFYLFAYGIPYFFCESEVNVDYRQATNQREGNFYPNVGGDIPDDWLQEISVPIIRDNQYTYNKTYSKQNKENFFAHLREDYDPAKLCLTEYPNRGIWSEPSNTEETKNNWLVYKPTSRYDFPKAYGKLVALDGIENRQVVARFENKTLLYNVLNTALTSVGQVYLGRPLFDTSVPPIDYADTDLGYIGSQHKMFLKTEMGHIQTDSKRGNIFLIQGQKAKDLTEANMSKFFDQFLKFEINRQFPEYNIDNHFNGCGLHGVYDPKYSRFILTKLDYKPLNKDIILKDGVFGVNKKRTVTTYPPVCPFGYKLINDACVKEIFSPATQISFVDFVAHLAPRVEYSVYGASLYSTFASDGTGTYTALPTNLVWTNIGATTGNGPLNRCGIWNSLSGAPTGTWVDVTNSITIEGTLPKTVYIGIGADNLGRIRVNCQDIMVMNPNNMSNNHTPVDLAVTFKWWHIYPITLNPGINYITVGNYNISSVGILGYEIYDNTALELAAATTVGDLNILFTTASLVGSRVEAFNYSCSGAVGCAPVIERDGVYYCSSIRTEAPNRRTTTTTVTDFIPVPFTDTTNFENNCFTISYNFKTQAWTSFHSYFPNYYTGVSNFFYAGRNDIESSWRHNTAISKFNNFFGVTEQYVIEYPLYFKGSDEILQSVKDYSKILKFTEYQEFVETDDVYFDRAVIYNNQQCSGTLKLTKKPKNSISSYSKYPIYHSDEKEILFTKANSFYQFNTFWALQKSSQSPMWLKSKENLSIYKDINNDNMNYSKRSFNKAPLMSKATLVRLINSETSDCKFVSQFIIADTQTSFL